MPRTSQAQGGGVCCAGDGFSMTVFIARDGENIRWCWWVGEQEVMIWHQTRGMLDVGVAIG